MGRGTNDGSIGPMPPTNRRVELPFCEIYHFGSDGKVIGGHPYFDMYGMLEQLRAAIVWSEFSVAIVEHLFGRRVTGKEAQLLEAIREAGDQGLDGTGQNQCSNTTCRWPNYGPSLRSGD